MKNFQPLVFLLLLNLIAFPLLAQENSWVSLSKVTFKKEYDEMLGFKVDRPVFSPELEKMDGKTIEIKGYIVPIEGYKSHTEFILSAYPYAMCFFCGGAGPETVMEVKTNSPVEYTDEPIVLTGRLELNSTDVNRLMYALEDARLVEGGR